MLINHSKAAVALRQVVNNPSDPASLFPLKFRLVSGHKDGTKFVQPAAASVPSAGLNLSGGH